MMQNAYLGSLVDQETQTSLNIKNENEKRFNDFDEFKKEFKARDKGVQEFMNKL